MPSAQAFRSFPLQGINLGKDVGEACWEDEKRINGKFQAAPPHPVPLPFLGSGGSSFTVISAMALPQLLH